MFISEDVSLTEAAITGFIYGCMFCVTLMLLALEWSERCYEKRHRERGQ